MAEKRRATTFRTSRGAIVNVAYPDIYIAPSIAPVDVTSPAEMREALREEDSWRKGILWFIGSSEYEMARLQAKGVKVTRAMLPKPNIAWDPWNVEKLANGNYLITDHAVDQVYEVTPEWDVTWEFGEFLVPGSDLMHLRGPRVAIYNPDLNTVLISDLLNRRILEVDYTTKNVLHVLLTTAVGDIDVDATASYGIDGIIVTSRRNHWVGEVRWDGSIIWEFGVYGVPGADLIHLNYPGSAVYDPWHQTYMIADSDNNRVLAVQKNHTVRKWYPALAPYIVKMSRSGMVCIGCHGDVGYICEWWGHIYFWPPQRTNVVTMTDDYTMMWSWEHQAFEVDLRTWKGGRRPNSEAFSYALAIAGSSPILPIHAFAAKDLCILAQSDQAATLEIYVGNPPIEPAVDVTGAADVVPATPWVLYDSVAMAANTVVPYAPTCKAPFIGVRVTMGGVGGTVKLWWHETWES